MIVGLVGLSLKQVLVVRVIVQFLETGGQSEICQLYMAATVKQDVVRFDVTKSSELNVQIPFKDERVRWRTPEA
jgi:hypothetical protein